MLDVISHVVLDDKHFYKENKLVHTITNDLGGPVSFATIPLEHYNIPLRIITSFGKDLPKKHQNYFQSKNLDLKVVNSEVTTKFLHELHENSRKMKIIQQATLLDEYCLDNCSNRAAFVSPVFHEISATTIEKLQNENRYEILAIDIQGLIRDKNESQDIIYNKTPEAEKASKIAHIVKYSLREAKYFTEKDNIHDIFYNLPQDNWQIITAGGEGVYFSKEGHIYHMSTVPVTEIDSTGAGDVFLASLVANFLLTNNFHHSVAIGMAMASESVLYRGISPIPKKDYDSIAKNILKSLKEI